MNYLSSKKPGNILSAFSPENEGNLSQKYADLKQEILSSKSSKELEEAWDRLLVAFEKETKLIKQIGSKIVPEVNFSEILKNNGKFPDDVIPEIKNRGCVVIRNVVDPTIALKYKKDVQNYIANHPGKIAGFPDDKPQVWELYWSKSQITARSHPNFNLATQALNQLWHADPSTLIDLSTNMTYCDRLRIRQPQDKTFTLNEHIDGGSVERWEDPEYSKCYSNILKGQWEKHDAFDATHRVDAHMDLYNCSGGCSMFRTFQGWMSMSNVKPGGGTLRVCPIIQLTTAYVILRPLLPDLSNGTNMAGAIPGVQQNILGDLHPHIIDAVVSVPEVNPGDCVFWHCDCVHAVEKVCDNPTDSSVLYIPSTPLCLKNAEYLVRQRHAFENGTSPHDFPLNNCEVTFDDRATPADLSELGKLGMGFTKFNEEDLTLEDGARNARKEANKILFKDSE